MGRGTGKRVLVVMELGSNWGHLLRMRPVVQALRAQGFTPSASVSAHLQAGLRFGSDASRSLCIRQGWPSSDYYGFFDVERIAEAVLDKLANPARARQTGRNARDFACNFSLAAGLKGYDELVMGSGRTEDALAQSLAATST